jgi:glycerol kinase
VGVGLWTVSDVRSGWRERTRFEPRISEDERESLLAGWSDALARTRSVELPGR